MKSVIFSLLLFLLYSCAPIFGQQVSTESMLKQQIETCSSDTAKARLYGELAWELKFTNSKDAIGFASKEIVIGYKYSNTQLLTQGYRAKAICNVRLNDILAAVHLYDSCLYYARKGKHLYYEASCNSLIAGMYVDQGDYDKSIFYYTQGLAIAKKSNSKLLLATLSNNLADAYQRAGRNTLLVQENFKLALKCNDELGDKWNVSFCAGNLAKEYASNQQWDSMNKYIDLAAKIFTYENKNPYALSTVCCQLSHIFLLKKEPAKVIPYATKAIKILDSLGRPDNVLQPISLMMAAHFDMGDLVGSEKFAKELLVKAKDRNAKASITEAYLTLSEISKKKEDYKQALFYFEQYKNWNDSIYTIARDQSISNIETKTMLAEKEFESKFKAEQKDKLNKELSAQNNKLFFQKWTAIIASILLFFAVIMLYVEKRKKERLHAQLLVEKNLIDKQAKEKLILLAEVHHRVKNNLTMLKSLFYLQSRATKNPETKMILAESQTRLQSMALVHKHLYNESDFVHLNFPLFLTEMLSELSRTFLDKSRNTEIEVHGHCTDLDSAKAIPLALIMNELVTNSLKYAFSEVADPKIIINISQRQNVLLIEYLDNGKGLDAEFDINKGGFGYKIMNILSQQIDANITYSKSPDFSIFKLELVL